MQFGKLVNFLDITLYIDDENKLQYRSYTKPTDAKRYLRPQSFHPSSVFTSVPLSQMIRTIERNSIEETEREEMEKMIQDFEQSGYQREELNKIEERARQQINIERNSSESDTLTFPLFYFKDLYSFKKILADNKDDLQQIIGNTKIIMAIKKNPSIGNTTVRNKLLSFEDKQLINQKCGATNCLQCPLVNTSATATVNGLRVKADKTLNCKSRNVVYLWQCQIYENDDSYFGRTIQKSHERTNTHRRCFSEEKWEDSALSMHAHNNHEEQFNLENFKITLVRKCSPQRIRREEFKYIDRYRTKTRGINRYKN